MRGILLVLFSIAVHGSMAQWGPPETIERSLLSVGYQALTGDLDGDGDLDVIARNGDAPNSSFYAFLNEGGWQFSAAYELDIPWDEEFMMWSLIDVDSDGRADLLPAYPQWCRNLGNFEFAAPQTLVAGSYNHLFADLDGQYGLDLVMFNLGGNPGCYYAHQLQNGSYPTPPQFSSLQVMFGTNGNAPPMLLDVTGDGIQDLLFLTEEVPGSWAIQAATGTALGAFNTPQLYYAIPDGRPIRDLSIGDRDPSNSNIGFKLSLSNPFETMWFEPTTGLEFTVSTTGLVAGDMLDLNGDGAQDLLYFSDQSFGTTISLNVGGGTFADPQDVSTAHGMLAYSHHLADMDDDGDLDAVILQYFMDRLAILENNGSGNLNTRHDVIAGEMPKCEQMELVDIDSDGDLDLLNRNSMDIRMLLNDGTGTYGPYILLDEQRQVSGFAHGDIDQDGDIDVVYGGYDYGVVLLLQGATGAFTTQEIGDALGGLGTSRMIDADLDGDLDVVVKESEVWGAVDYFLIENLGGGAFAEPVEVNDDGAFLMECVLVDMNDDGLLDRVGDINGTIGMFINTGGTLDEPLLFDGTYGKPAMVSDLNGDGLLDLIADAGASLVIWHATASFVYEIAQTVALFTPLADAQLQDVDNDGRVDLVQTYAGQVLLQRCAAEGLLGPSAVVWDLGSGRSHVRTGDVTGDGNVDIITGKWLVGSWTELLTNLSASDHQLTGRIFHDQNDDQAYQPGEDSLPWVPIHVSPDASSPFTDVDGVYTVYATLGSYTLQPVLDPDLWTVTSTSPLQATLTNGEPVADGLDFAIVPAQEISLLYASLVQGAAACGDTTFLTLNIANAGTRIEQGTVTLQLGQNTTFLSSTQTPASVVGNTITWTFDDLGFYEVRSIAMRVITPTLGSIGEQWLHQLQVVSLDDGGSTLSTANAVLSEVVVCAYDPNDKQVHPAGYGQAGAVDIATPYLDYTIRFQNTGTAPAFDVVIMDHLDPDLDPERVEILGFSHTPAQIAITANGSIQFKFLNIMLPDSASDQLGSQGFVHFRIHLREGLPHLTEIPNTAAIYFDLNPPIVTNTTTTTLVDCATWQPVLQDDGAGLLIAPEGDDHQWFLNGEPIFGAVGDSILITSNGNYTVEVTSTLGCVATTPAIIATELPETMAEAGFIVVPNPFTHHARLIAEEVLTTGTTVEVIDRLGRVVNTLSGNGSRSVDLDRGQLVGGLYLVRISRPGKAPLTLRVVVQ